jgi:hypothetical protein
VDRLHQTLDASRIHHDCPAKLIRGTRSPQTMFVTVRPMDRSVAPPSRTPARSAMR